MAAERKGIFLGPGEGRDYPMGAIRALFKADEGETAGKYSISEWWLEPHTRGPGAHSHPEDDVFYVLEGTMSFLVDERWLDAPTLGPADVVWVACAALDLRNLFLRKPPAATADGASRVMITACRWGGPLRSS